MKMLTIDLRVPAFETNLFQSFLLGSTDLPHCGRFLRGDVHTYSQWVSASAPAASRPSRRAFLLVQIALSTLDVVEPIPSSRCRANSERGARRNTFENPRIKSGISHGRACARLRECAINGPAPHLVDCVSLGQPVAATKGNVFRSAG
jgi:hypothetical protein